LTAEKFVPDPFAPRDLVGEAASFASQRAKLAASPTERSEPRLYRTGDLCVLAANGEIEYLGRIDTQVKIRGYRIELSEIEAVLLEDGAVSNAIVALVSGEGGVDELAAYVVARSDDFAELCQHLHATLRHRLPVYMVPAYIERLDAIPMLPSQKADRARLPKP